LKARFIKIKMRVANPTKLKYMNYINLPEITGIQLFVGDSKFMKKLVQLQKYNYLSIYAKRNILLAHVSPLLKEN
jgi:hypothetical protein